jgi:CO/xanthine dehydrogenase FAD-binding subunit
VTSGYVRPSGLAELLQLRRDHPDWLLLAGGTDVMVGVNFGRLRPEGVIDVGAVAELNGCTTEGDSLRLGAGVTFRTIEKELASLVPGLAIAARGVGSPQIRATATLGGNLGTASPAGDSHPILIALDATVELASLRCTRFVPAHEFFTGPGRSVLADDEVIAAVRLPRSLGSRQQFSKIGARNAMVIAIAALGLVVDAKARRVGVGLGSVGPTPIRASSAEELLTQELWPDGDDGPLRRPSAAVLTAFADEVRRSARPIDDLRAPASYRSQTVAVMARRCLARCLEDGS